MSGLTPLLNLVLLVTVTNKKNVKET